MRAILSTVMHTIGQTVMIPCLIILILLIIVALWQVGDILVETITERKKMKEDVPQLLKDIHNSSNDEIRVIIEKSMLLTRQKIAIYELIDSSDMSRPSLEALAERLLATEQEKYEKAVEITDLVAKLGPMFGLLGTLIPLGPGIIALGQGDTKTLSESIGVAFDTTIAGMLAASIALVISSIRKRWYNGYMVSLESIMECILEEVAPNDAK
ncbi:MAG: MotA/TolQ/ExbB proton channel family protein [Eubacteriales bacterium]|nr:MotA/TolQ/ExbB proton channel family protein [Eubacteriales bacterium]